MHLDRLALMLAFVLLALPGLAAGDAVRKGPAKQVPAKAPGDSPMLVKVATPVGGIILNLGGENRLAVGDRVKAGQALVQLDTRLAENDVESAKAKLQTAEGEYVVAQSATQSAQTQLDRANQLLRKGAMSPEDVTAIQMTRDRQQLREKTKAQALQVVRLEVQRAQLLVDMHRLHSPVNGIIRAIYKTRGEGVQAFDSIILIEETAEK